MGSSKSIVSRSVYVARLRRAFILRCHPDRFRQHDDSIVKQQSVLLQALGERMIEADFKNYTLNIGRKGSNRAFRTNQQHVVNYAIEKRDGTLLNQTLNLNSSVESILQNMAAALESSGAAKLPPPPSTPEAPHSNDKSEIHWVQYDPHGSRQHHTKNNNSNASRIDHQYNVNSNRGRDLKRFLSSTTPSQIEERRAHRMDAVALALVARRLFSFQSIDGVHLGWSSKSFAGLLTSLIKLHEEHSHRFHVQKFYPLRLTFSHNEKKPSLDVYGGTISLNPAGTQLDWLASMKEVTDERLEKFSIHRRIVMERVGLLQEGLIGENDNASNNMRVRKGFTCSSLEYYLFLERVTEPYAKAKLISATNPVSESNDLTPVVSSSSVCPNRHLRLVVESSMSCRRPRVTKEGSIQVPATITSEELVSAISKLSVLAEERWEAEERQKDRCREAIEEVQMRLGLEKVSRSNERVRREDFVGALSRMIDHESHLREAFLPGSNLQIGTSGQFCHLSDDGSLVIPHNWT